MVGEVSVRALQLGDGLWRGGERVVDALGKLDGRGVDDDGVEEAVVEALDARATGVVVEHTVAGHETVVRRELDLVGADDRGDKTRGQVGRVTDGRQRDAEPESLGRQIGQRRGQGCDRRAALARRQLDRAPVGIDANNEVVAVHEPDVRAAIAAVFELVADGVSVDVVENDGVGGFVHLADRAHARFGLEHGIGRHIAIQGQFMARAVLEVQLAVQRGAQPAQDLHVADCAAAVARQVQRRFVDGIVFGIGRIVGLRQRVVRAVLVGPGGIVQVVGGQPSRREAADDGAALGQGRDRDAAAGGLDACIGIGNKCLDVVLDLVEGQRQADRDRHAGGGAKADGQRGRDRHRIDAR